MTNNPTPNIKTPEEQFIENIKKIFDDYERQMLSRRIKQGINNKKKGGGK